MILRPATLDDFTELVLMYKDLIKTVYHNMKLSEDIYFYGAVIEWFKLKKDIVIAEQEGVIVGFTLAYVENLQIVEPYYFGDIAYIKPEYRKGRAGYLLYNNVVTYGKELGLKVEARAFIGNGNVNKIDKIQSKFGIPEFIHFRTEA